MDDLDMIMRTVSSKVKEFTSLKGISSLELDWWSQRLICILGPSGVGKSALCQAILSFYPDKFYLLGSTVTRHLTCKEIELNNYRCVSTGVFDRMISEGAFLHWFKPKSGWYGIEKDRLRTAVGTQKNVLVVFRSLSGGILKWILPKMKVIQLRAPIEVLTVRIKRRNRLETKIPEVRFKSAAEDLAANEDMFKYWKKKTGANWYQLDNTINAPPIAEEIVIKAFQIANPEGNV